MKEMLYNGEFGVLLTGTYNNHKFAIISTGSHPCAYVENKLGVKDYDDAELWDVDVHGGFTYCNIGYWGEGSQEHKWLGWDYAHVDDYYYNVHGTSEGKMWTTQEIYEEVIKVIDQLAIVEKDKEYEKQHNEFEVGDAVVFNCRDGYMLHKLFPDVYPYVGATGTITGMFNVVDNKHQFIRVTVKWDDDKALCRTPVNPSGTGIDVSLLNRRIVAMRGIQIGDKVKYRDNYLTNLLHESNPSIYPLRNTIGTVKNIYKHDRIYYEIQWPNGSVMSYFGYKSCVEYNYIEKSGGTKTCLNTNLQTRQCRP